MKILAHGHYSQPVETEVPPLKELVRETTGQPVRRVGRLIQLALIGAGRCLHGQPLPTDTAVYLSSGRGDLEITLEVLEQMVEQGLPPKPLSFINTVSNSACFYLARHFGLHGRNHFVTRRRAPLESALQLAALDMAEGAVQTALLGSVDICTRPLDQHRKRLAVSADTVIGEGSHWFLLASDGYSGDSIGQVTAVENLADRHALTGWLARGEFDRSNTVLATGQHVSAAQAADLQSLTGITQRLQPAAPPPWYDSHCGLVLGQFLSEPPAQHLLYIDSDHSGRYNLIALQRPC